MIRQKHINVTLWLSLVFNCIAAYLIAFPSSFFSQLVGLPPSVPFLYSTLLSCIIIFFGIIYAWLAIQSTIEKHLFFIGGTGKILFFLGVFLSYLFGHASATFTTLASVDLILGAVWLWWLFSNKSTQNT